MIHARHPAQRLGSLVATLAVLVLPARAAAQSAAPQPGPPGATPPRAQSAASSKPERRRGLDRHRGFLIGFSLGGGMVVSSECADCFPRGMAIDAAAGWFVNRRWALMYDVHAVITVDASSGISAANALQAVAVQYWPTTGVWLKGGLGVARLLVATPFGDGEVTGGGMTLAAGLELVEGRGNFGLDLQLRAAHSEFDGGSLTNVALLLGFNWY